MTRVDTGWPPMKLSSRGAKRRGNPVPGTLGSDSLPRVNHFVVRQQIKKIARSGLVLLTALLVLITVAQCPTANAEDTASRIQAKIAEVGAGATKLRESGGDVSPIQQAMQQVSQLLQSGNPADAEKILDTLLTRLGMPTTGATVIPVAGRNCDPQQPMTVSSSVTISDDCTVGGDLTVTGNAVLHFDFTGHNGRRLVIAGNVIVQDHAVLWIEGRPENRAVFAVANDFNAHRSMTSSDDAAIKLNYVEFRTQKERDRGKGSLYMSYEAHGRSSFEANGSMLVAEESWLLANLHDSSRLIVADTLHVPTEIYIADSASAKISGRATQTGLWLDAGGVKGSLKIPNVNGPFSWHVGNGNGLDVKWSLQVDDAQPGLGIEVRPTSALTITGNGARAPLGGELKISYFVGESPETLDGLKAGLQNRKISDRLTLKDVQLGPIAWQVYAGDNADLTAGNSTINEIGIFGRNAKVRVEHSILQLAVLGAMAPGCSLDIHDSQIWNQTVEAANSARVSITDSRIYGTLFLSRNTESVIAIKGGSFHDNPAGCTPATMVDIATGQPRCNPFRTPGMPRFDGPGKVDCAGTEGCNWKH